MHDVASNFLWDGAALWTDTSSFITFYFAFYTQAYYLLHPGIPLLSLGNSLPPSLVFPFLSLNPSFIYSSFLSGSAYISLTPFSVPCSLISSTPPPHIRCFISAISSPVFFPFIKSFRAESDKEYERKREREGGEADLDWQQSRW